MVKSEVNYSQSNRFMKDTNQNSEVHVTIGTVALWLFIKL